MGWAIYPQGLRQHVRTTWRRYGLPIHVTENGLADREDVYRKRFIHDHLQELHAAIEDGADVRGYFHWSLIDNFEWRDGFEPRFGLVAIDYATQERSVRESAHYYAKVCAANGLTVTDTGRTHRSG
jgi:beta-glucosidase/6-phospho-beta-glucosidase/beta-galactosidase